jgi:hypothetical protein
MTIRAEIDLLLDDMNNAELEHVRDRIRLQKMPASRTLPGPAWRRSRSEFHDLVYREAARLIAEQSAKRHAEEEEETPEAG